MAIQVISGVTSDVWTVDPTSKAGRITLYDSTGAVLGSTANPLKTQAASGRTLVGEYLASSFRTVGIAATNVSLFALSLGAGASVSIALKNLVLVMDQTGALLTVSPVVAMGRTTVLPTGGTALALPRFKTSYATSQAVALGATAADGGAATAITATIAERAYSTMRDRLATAVGFVSHYEVNLLPPYARDTPLIIAPGQGIVVQVVQAGLTTDHALVQAAWEEFT